MKLRDIISNKLNSFTREQVRTMCSQSKNQQEFLETFLDIKISRMNGTYRRAVYCIQKHFSISINWSSKERRVRAREETIYRPVDMYLRENGPFTTTHRLRLKLLREGIKSCCCEICLNTQWMGRPIPLELHHINGRHNDNRLVNLQLLCPNCHSQTDNYKSKNSVEV